jgi:hypothetical protein
MLKRIALLGAMAALTIVKPSNAIAQGWDGWCCSCPGCVYQPQMKHLRLRVWVCNA